MKKTTFAALVLLLATCVELHTIEQPLEVAVGGHFTIRVTGTVGGITLYTQTGFLGLMLPDGIQVDSARYTNDAGDTALITEPNSSISVWLAVSCPCDTSMRWTAFVHQNMASYTPYEALIYARVTGSADTGRYLVDYRTGYYYQGWSLSDSILDQPMTVTDDTTGVAEREAKITLGHGRVWPAVFRDRLNIAVPEPGNVRVTDANGRLVRAIQVGQSGYWDGTDESGRRVPAGAYFVRSGQLRSRVTLVD